MCFVHFVICVYDVRWTFLIIHLVYELFSSFADSEGEDDHED